MGKRPLNVTKNRKVMWSITWLLHEILSNVTKNRKISWLDTLQSDYKKGCFCSIESSVFWIPSLVCPVLNWSSFEVKDSASGLNVSLLKWSRRSLCEVKSLGFIFFALAPLIRVNLACLGEILSLYSASLVIPNWPLLPDCYCQKTDVLCSPVVLFPE